MSITTNRVLVFNSTNVRGLANVTALVEGTGKNGKPISNTAILSDLSEAIAEEYDCDAHVVSYYLTEPEGAVAYPRLTKTALAQIRALGGDVLCSAVFIDIDLHDLLGRKGKTPWNSLPEQEAAALWEKLQAKIPGLPAPAAVYTTRNGVRIVHPLLFDVKAGVTFEAILARVHRAYLDAGIKIDESCSDWTRLYRLPLVVRDNEPTSDQDWFKLYLCEDWQAGEVFLIPEQADIDLKDNDTIVRYEHAEIPDVPSDEEAFLLLFDERGKPTDVLKSIRQRLRQTPLASYINGQNAVIPEGKRNDTIVKLAGVLSRTGEPVQVCYAVILESIKLLDDDEPWRDIAWRKLVEFRRKDEAAQRAEQRVIPDRLKQHKRGQEEQNEAAPAEAEQEDDIDPETGLRRLPEYEMHAEWINEAIDGELVVSEKGAVLQTERNAALMLASLGYSLHRNIFSDGVVIKGPDLPKEGEPLNDFHLLDLVRQFRENGFNTRKDQMQDFLRTCAHAHHYHPVRHYLRSVEWDGAPRVEQWLCTYFGVKDTPYARCVGAVTLVGAVRRVFEPGCKHDTMLVLEGGQGGYKSTALKILAYNENWYTDNFRVDSSSKDIMETVAGHWIVEAAEVIGVRKGDPDKLKNTLSREREKARLAYGHNAQEYRRQFIIIGTTNHTDYLTDSTGNRRYWPVFVGDVDIDGLLRDRDQLWAEAVVMWQRSEHYVMPPELYPAAAEEQDKRRSVKNNATYEYVFAALDSIDAGAFDGSAMWKAIGIESAGRRGVMIREALKDLGWRKISAKLWAKGEGDVPVYDVQALGDGAFKMRKTKETKQV